MTRDSILVVMKARVSILLLFLTFFSFIVPSVLADSHVAASGSATTKKQIEYAMPYPGLLPDSPFYGLKMFRDRVVGFLISDPLKQAEFDLLQSDKRIGAGIYLINKDAKKASLSLTTVSKGQQYFKKAIADSRSAKTQGYPIKTFTSKLHLSAQKQQELLKDIAKKIPSSEKVFYQKIMKTADELVEEAAMLDLKEHAKK